MKTWSKLILVLLLAGLCARGVAQRANETVAGELGDKLDAHLKHAASNGFAGVVLVMKDGQVILSKGYGMANRERKIPVTLDTIFDIGSLVKQFTAAAILKPHGERSIGTNLTIGCVTLNESELLQVVWDPHITPRSGFVLLCSRCPVDCRVKTGAKPANSRYLHNGHYGWSRATLLKEMGRNLFLAPFVPVRA
ncbi:MAG TPA: serine hydrolase domain-containing protein [Pyrinomonadaceae bacterium]|nr:serine hydrolase domain-containing protein [Pyrinomonadaceae bacterium]